MQKEVISVDTYYYLPWRGVWAALLLTRAVALIAAGRYVTGCVPMILAALVITAHYGIRIDLNKKTYCDFLSMLWIVSGEEKEFTAIDYVFIKSSKRSQTMNSMATTKTFSDDFYDGYIKFDQYEKIFLLTHKKKSRVMRTLTELSSQLGVDIVDHTGE